VDARADLWALGVLLYELLTGRRPFEDENERSVSRAILHDEPIPPSALRAELDPELEQLVLQLLRKDATERPTSADEVGSRLNALASPPLPLGGARQGRRRSLQPVAVVLVIVAVAGVIAGVRLLADHVGSPSVRENAVMVMPFRTSERSPNADLGEGLADLLSLRLTGEPGPEAIDMRMTLNALRAAGDPSPAQLTSMAALRIARSAGVGQVVLGEIIEARGRLVVTGTLHDGSGARKTTVSGAPDSLLSLADRLAAQLLGRAAGEDEQSLESMTSSSLAAVRAYLLGRSAYRRGEFGTAVRSYRTALDYDSTFALAALGLELAVVWGQPDALGAWGSRLAVQHRDRLPPRDRALVELLYMNLDEPPRERLRRFEQYTQRYPDRPEGWVGLGEHLYHAGGDAVVGPIGELSLAAFRRAIELEPRHPAAYIHVIDVLAFREDTATLRQTTDAFRTILSASSTSTSAAAASLWLAATVLEDSVRLASIRAGLESLPDNGLTSIPLYAWRSAVDPTDAEHALDIAERRASTAERLAHVRYIRFMLFLNTGRPGLARAALERWGQAVDDPGRTWSQVLHIAYPEGDTTGTGIGERRLASLMIDGDPYADGRRYCMLGLIAHRKGRLTSAHLPALRRRVAAGGEALPLLPCLRALEAVLAHANEVPDARARLAVLDSVLERTPYSPTWSVQWPQLISVQLHRERGELEAALHAVNLICGGCFLHTPATLERARINALLGNHAEAIHYYRHYLRLLANPEPGPATELAKTARTELARLLP
ncbi:MAG TPA: hypothetical protein VK933_04595, partial [Longimicrobiales bacterium]|nr:hypothetical protein [Longimicrobiales bacterium]